MTTQASVLLADFLEPRKEALCGALLKALRATFQETAKPYVPQWVENQIQQLRGAPDRSGEWAAVLVEIVRGAGEGLDKAVEQVQAFRRVILEFSRGQLPGLSDVGLYDLILDVEDRQVQLLAEHCDQIERDVLASERRRQRVLLESMDRAFVTLTPEGAIDSGNEFFAHRIGLPLDSLIGKELISFCDEAAAAELRKVLRQKRSVGSQAFNGHLQGPKGRRVAMRFVLHFIFDARGHRVGIAIAFESAAPRHLTLDECLTYVGQEVLNLLPTPVQIFDRKHVVVYANDAARRLELPQGDPGQPYCCQILRRTAQTGDNCSCQQVFETGAPVLREVCWGEEGSQQWFQLLSLPLCEPNGELSYGICALRDITRDRGLAKSLEKQMLAQQRTSLASQLAMTVAHQLRNPLGVIIGFAEMLSRGLPPEQVPGAVDKLLRNGLRCKEIVGDLLEFGQGFPGERLPTDLNALVRSAVQTMFPASQNQRITWGLTTEPVLVECVPHQLAQVFVSLIENALRAAKTQVAFNVVPKPGQVLIRISDDGPGVPKELRTRIFQPFFTTYKEEGCLGLGLSLSQSVVDEYGGKIVLETPSGHGACFVVQLPVASAEGQAGETIESIKEPASTGKRILVVDDEVDLLDMLTIVLEQRGYVVDAAGTVARAIDLVQKTTYDAVVLDVQLPGELSGPQFYAHLSQTCPDLARKTMFITADTMNYETRRFLDEVQRPSMEKPFLVSEFLAQVTGLMQV